LLIGPVGVPVVISVSNPMSNPMNLFFCCLKMPACVPKIKSKL
jgi:hypothetical protein